LNVALQGSDRVVLIREVGRACRHCGSGNDTAEDTECYMADFAAPRHTHDGPPTDLIVNFSFAISGSKLKANEQQKSAHSVAGTAQFLVFTHLLRNHTQFA
jgi:hypothetical protein